jgi:hypothetical protein
MIRLCEPPSSIRFEEFVARSADDPQHILSLVKVDEFAHRGPPRRVLGTNNLDALADTS